MVEPMHGLYFKLVYNLEHKKIPLAADAWATGVAYNELHQHPTILVPFNNNSARNVIFAKTEALNAGIFEQEVHNKLHAAYLARLP